MHFLTTVIKVVLSACTDLHPHGKGPDTKSGCVQPGSVQEHCFTNTELSSIATGHCCGLHPAWQEVSQPAIPVPISAGLEDPGTLEDRGQSRSQYLEPESQLALPGPTYTGKGSNEESESGTLHTPYLAQPPGHSQASCSGQLLGGSPL